MRAVHLSPIISSFISFQFLKFCSQHFLTPKSVQLQGKVAVWKWMNTLNSLIHSILTGIGSLLCFYLHPEAASDIVMFYSEGSHFLTTLSVGYFIFDIFDMLLHHRKRSSYELVLHHVLVISCFGLSLLTRRYQGFVLIALVIEVNSIFLHLRQLLILCGQGKSTLYYRAVSILNIATFLLFRFITLGWMFSWLNLEGYRKVPKSVYGLGCIATSLISVMSFILFLRVLRADFHVINRSQLQKTS